MVVAKKPTPGQTKTRLCPPLTFVQAAELYDCFLRDTLDTMRKVTEVRRVVGFLPDDASGYFQDLAPDMEIFHQIGDNLGERLDNLLTSFLKNGSRKAVVMDSDSPTLPSEFIEIAFSTLENVDVVLGPTLDGGYYLIGLSYHHNL